MLYGPVSSPPRPFRAASVDPLLCASPSVSTLSDSAVPSPVVSEVAYNSNADEDDVFEDLAVERERLRKHRRRRKKRRRLLQQQQQQPDADALHDRGVGVGVGGGCVSSKHSVYDVHTECDIAAAAAAATSVCAGDSHGEGASSVLVGERGCLPVTKEKEAYNGDETLGGKNNDDREVSDGHGSVPTATTARGAAAAGTLNCEGLAELSQVPDLLNDESIAAAVLAATLGGGGGGEIGAPEMTVTGRRLNREVRVLSFYGTVAGTATFAGVKIGSRTLKVEFSPFVRFFFLILILGNDCVGTAAGGVGYCFEHRRWVHVTPFLCREFCPAAAYVCFPAHPPLRALAVPGMVMGPIPSSFPFVCSLFVTAFYNNCCA